MSFYIYYGKLKDQLMVTVLPNGTVEHDDPIYIYTKAKGLTSHKATDVKVTNESEDLVNFKDGDRKYTIVTKKAYKELTLTIKTNDGKTTTAELTRHYDQPFAAIDTSDPPKIWTGPITFHSWADNEAFFLITPKGLGNGKPVVSIWQWTKDAEKGERSLTYATGQQKSQTAHPNIFSFKHNGYYALECNINTKTDTLNVTVKDPSNKDAALKEMALTKKVSVGAEHKLSPPRGTIEKITLECSYPKAASSLKKYNGLLPFPADLIETLRHSAAYIDQAGYLANHTVNQYNQLDRSYLMLEKKAEARAARIVVLEGDVANYLANNKALQAKNKTLLEQFSDYRAAAEQREADLEKRLRETAALLAESRAKVKSQEDHIEKDKAADEAFAKKVAIHDKEDHDRIKALEGEVKAAEAAAKAAAECAKEDADKLVAEIKRLKIKIADLETKLCDKDTIISGLKSELESAQKQIGKHVAAIATLNVQLKDANAEKSALQTKLDSEMSLHTKTKQDLAKAQKSAADIQAELTSELTIMTGKRDSLQNKLNKSEAELEVTRTARNKAEQSALDSENELETKDGEWARLRAEFKAVIAGLRKQVEEAGLTPFEVVKSSGAVLQQKDDIHRADGSLIEASA